MPAPVGELRSRGPSWRLAGEFEGGGIMGIAKVEAMEILEGGEMRRDKGGRT
jgi:hypothetical protein